MLYDRGFSAGIILTTMQYSSQDKCILAWHSTIRCQALVPRPPQLYPVGTQSLDATLLHWIEPTFSAVAPYYLPLICVLGNGPRLAVPPSPLLQVVLP